MIKPQWQQLVNREAKQEYFQNLVTEIAKQRTAEMAIYPAEKDVFNAFKYVDLADVKVVILGQDPYHGKDQAHGLAFSVPVGIKVPPSLVNIYKELSTDIKGFTTPTHGCLTHWAKQGVLLLNTVLTVQQANAHSHAKLGWESFTQQVIEELNNHNKGCVFILWGAHAHKKGKNINQEKHLVLAGPHPSPLSAYRGFYGCQHFSKTNVWLTHRKVSAINWQLPMNTSPDDNE
ncbi:uracil-DNA glycosylase [Colwellia sp. TT2012]|uniref:uracil-DNA glycosylase n=1 Tax=Colwellia sp. TT2012 TaxID=1720342 RepID=UPI00070DE0D8|nr:uracil-DNA glycosylase [Colwellia sp. TT2012]